MTINDPNNCLDRLFLANIIPAPIPSDQLSVRWIDLAQVACRLLDRIEALEARLKEVNAHGARAEEGT